MTELGKKPLTLHSQPPSEFKRAYCVSWMFIGRTKAEAETRILWSSAVKSWLIGKDLMLGKIEGQRGRQRIRWLHGITNSTDMNLSKLQEIVKGREAWCAAVHWVTKSWTWLIYWTTIVLPTLTAKVSRKRLIPPSLSLPSKGPRWEPPGWAILPPAYPLWEPGAEAAGKTRAVSPFSPWVPLGGALWLQCGDSLSLHPCHALLSPPGGGGGVRETENRLEEEKKSLISLTFFSELGCAWLSWSAKL